MIHPDLVGHVVIKIPASSAPSASILMAMGQKRLGLSGLIKRVHHGIRLARKSRKSDCITYYSSKWRKIMLTLMPSMSVGLGGSVLIAIALTADWYIWAFRYRIARLLGPELGPPADGKDLIHVPSASGRELVVNLAAQWLDRYVPPIHQVESEWLDPRAGLRWQKNGHCREQETSD